MTGPCSRGVMQMLGKMMARPLLVSQILEHGLNYYGDTEIVSRTVEGPIHRYRFADAGVRIRQLANALGRLGIELGDRVGTLAWNTHRHYELYYGVSGTGAVIHTINPRLFADQIVYIANHARDRVMFVDLTFVELLEGLADRLATIEHFVIMTDRAHMPATSLPNVLCYEELIAAESDACEWPEFDENTACGLCYTSGTTGNPKGVLYSNRSTVLHAMAACMEQSLGISMRTVVLPVVPMFHVNAWGVPYAATITGAKMVFPGPMLDGAHLYELIESERPDLLMGVPTVWLNLLAHLKAHGGRLDSVERIVIGGSAVPASLVKELDEAHGVFVLHVWGMTEMSPVGTATPSTPALEAMAPDARHAAQLRQGKAAFGVEMKIIDDDGVPLPHDGTAFGRLLVRGPWITDGYFEVEDRSSFVDGWFDTGDVANIDPSGSMQIVDRSKDVIKSGGEWISSIDLENLAVGHPDLQEACVIGVRHPKWDERPIVLAVPHPGTAPTEASVLEYMQGRIARWWLPDAVLFVDELPHTATGKLMKTGLRETYRDYLIERAQA